MDPLDLWYCVKRNGSLEPALPIIAWHGRMEMEELAVNNKVEAEREGLVVSTSLIWPVWHTNRH